MKTIDDILDSQAELTYCSVRDVLTSFGVSENDAESAALIEARKISPTFEWW